MALIPVQEAGNISFQPADSNGDSFENDGNVQIWVSGPPTGFTVEFQNAKPCNYSREDHPEDHQTYDLVVVAGNTQGVAKRLAPSRFTGADSLTNMTYSPSAVGIQVAAIRVDVARRDES